MNRLLRTIGGCGLAVVIIIALVMGLFVSNSTDDSSVPDATPPVGGKEVANIDVNAPGRTERAFVFQDYNLLESLNARKNATLTAHFSGRRCTRDAVQKTFASLGLDGLERRLPAQLSGGQQQRVAVARALLAGAPYIFADEPTGALDDATAQLVLTHLRTAARGGAAVVMVTHSHLAAEAADRIIELQEANHAGVA